MSDLSPPNGPAQRWCVRFNTKDGAYHSAWFKFGTLATEQEVRLEAEKYLKGQSNWLNGIDDVYPQI